MQAQEKTPCKRIVVNRGLSAFAREQRVTINHAWRVITGRRESARLLAAWQAFQARKSA